MSHRGAKTAKGIDRQRAVLFCQLASLCVSKILTVHLAYAIPVTQHTVHVTKRVMVLNLREIDRCHVVPLC